VLPAARLPQLLGDQLVGTPRLAVFEHVKNAHDAVSEKVTFTLGGVGTPEPFILVEDDARSCQVLA
jgi:hypothetical protein